LMAVHAAVETGHDVAVFSRKVMSPMGGAQYLHAPVPGINSEPHGQVRYHKRGNARGYATKVYGNPDRPTSWQLFSGTHDAWQLRETYRRLVMRYWGLVADTTLEARDVRYVCEEYDLTFSTVPAKLLCRTPSEHSFLEQEVYLHPSTTLTQDNTIVYSGVDPREQPWYRTSLIFGEGWTEYSARYAPQQVRSDQRTVHGVKPLSTDCGCHTMQPGYVRLGRFGQWRKGVLTSDAYADAQRALADAQVAA